MGTKQSRKKECWHLEEKRYRKRVRIQKEKGRQTTKQRGIERSNGWAWPEGLMSPSGQPTTKKKRDKRVLLSSRLSRG